MGNTNDGKPVTMTGLMDALIKELGATRANKAAHDGAYALKTAAIVAAQVQEAFPDRDLKGLKTLFYSRRAVISAWLEKKANEQDAAGELAA
jgi:hypothetical protein